MYKNENFFILNWIKIVFKNSQILTSNDMQKAKKR